VLVLTASAHAEPLPYAPHPDRYFGTIDQQYANFEVTEALHRIAMLLDSVPLERQEMLRETLAAQPELIELLGMSDQSVDQRKLTIQGAQTTWLRSYPSTGSEAGNAALVTLTPRRLRQQAHGLIRLSYDLAGLPRPNSARAILADTIFGPNPADQNDKIRAIRDTLRDVCTSRKTVLDDDVTSPAEFKWVRWALRNVPGSGLLKELAEGQLGTGKSCESLSADVIDLVEPHQSPLRRTIREFGQLEGTSLFLARLYFEGGDPADRPLGRALRQLRNTGALEVSMDEATAVAGALGGSLSNAWLVRLMAMASHNHGLELYLQKAELQLNENADSAIETADETLRDLNHFYALLAEHRAARKVAQPDDAIASAARPYHYWGGAFVACELRARGYRPWVSTLVSGMLGKVYEGWTRSNGEGLSGKSEDISLHIRGAQDWASRCLNP
jgi:hypothetical protein